MTTFGPINPSNAVQDPFWGLDLDPNPLKVTLKLDNFNYRVRGSLT